MSILNNIFNSIDSTLTDLSNAINNFFSGVPQGQVSQALLHQMQLDAAQLATDPTNTALRARLLQEQVYLTQHQLNVSPKEAADVVRSMTAVYATSKNIDPNSILDNITANEQQILNYDPSKQTVYGLSINSALQLSGYLGVASGVLLTGALTLFVVALFTVGPEAAAAIAAGEGVVGTIAGALGTPTIAYGGFLFLLSQFFGHLSSNIPMITKQMIDNGSIGPGLRISALKDAQDLQDKLAGTASPGPFTAAQFKDYTQAVESGGIASIQDPKTGTISPYSQKALSQAIIYIYGQQILAGTKSTFTSVKNALTPYLLKTNQKPSAAPAISNSPQIQNTTQSASTTKASQTKVFTGVVSSGLVGAGLSFTARPDDIIQSISDLQDAASNNLAPFLAALPGKVIYEIKVVSSITTKDGFTQTGAAQKIQTGTHKDGTPIYKTVINKFATLILYILTDKGTRTKITTIVLGPVDSAKFQVSQNDLVSLQQKLPSVVTTSDVSTITGIVTNTPVVVTPPPVTATTAPVQLQLGSTQFYKTNVNGADQYITIPWAGNVPYSYVPISKDEFISGLTAKIQKGQALASQYSRVVTNGASTFRYDANGQAYVGSEILDDTAIAGINKQISDIQKGVGVFAPNYIDPGMSKFQAYAPTPSEQYYTQAYFSTLPKQEQDRLTALYPDYNFKFDGATVSGSAPAVNKNGVYQIEKSDVPGGRELIYYPPGMTPNASLKLVPITLTEWYQTQGQQLPSIADRATLYQSLGLGQSTYYTGTAEQNAKLLGALAAAG